MLNKIFNSISKIAIMASLIISPGYGKETGKTANSKSVSLKSKIVKKNNFSLKKNFPRKVQKKRNLKSFSDPASLDPISNDSLQTLPHSQEESKFTKEYLKPILNTQHLNLLKELKDYFANKENSISKTQISNLNQVKDQLSKTVTGSIFKHISKKDTSMEVALKRNVTLMLRKILKDDKKVYQIASPAIIDTLKKDFKGITQEVTELCREVLANSTLYADDYYTFYHGHGNGLRLYFDILREIKSFESIRNLDSSNPLRDKSGTSSGNSVDEILMNYEEKALEYAAANNKSLYDLKRAMGVGFAPDKIDYFRDNVISVNPNLFGNMNTLAECTLFYWLDSFNISNPNEVLVKNLLGRISSHLSEDQMQERISQYSTLYSEFMKETGGNLMQIHVKKSIVDDISFASWMKGIPVLRDKQTHKLATRGGNNRPVPVLTDTDGLYERPRTSEYLDLLIQDPEKFIDTYSDFSKGKKTRDVTESLDRPQARLIINPTYFNDPDLVKVNHYTRFKASDLALETYQNSLKKLIQEDMSSYLIHLQAGTATAQSGNSLTKLTQFIEEGTEFSAVKNAQSKSRQIVQEKE